MKYCILLVLLVFSARVMIAQNAPDTPAYKKYPTVPPISLLQVDSTVLTKDQLNKHQATLVMFFSPSCDHCQHQWEDMRKNMEALKDVQIVMATYQPYEEMKEFYIAQHIADYPNIKMGRDEQFVLPPFYRIQSLPFQALYDKKGNLVNTFEGNVKVEKMMQALKTSTK